jgi:hypothetical protein
MPQQAPHVCYRGIGVARSARHAPPFANDGGCLSRAAPQGFTAVGAPGLTDASTAIGRH